MSDEFATSGNRSTASCLESVATSGTVRNPSCPEKSLRVSDGSTRQTACNGASGGAMVTCSGCCDFDVARVAVNHRFRNCEISKNILGTQISAISPWRNRFGHSMLLQSMYCRPRGLGDGVLS